MKNKIKKILTVLVVLSIAGLIFSLVSDGEVAETETATKKPAFTFIALGDSVASGMGLPTYSDPTACDRTEESYPQQLAKELDADVVHLACSGARYYSGILEPQVVNNLEISSQVSKFDDSKTPEFITLTAGANTTDWVEVITNCYLNDCGTTQDTQDFDSNLDTVTNGLRETLESIKATYTTAPTVYITKYHQVIPAEPGLECRDLSGITNSERIWARNQQLKLNNALQDITANYSFAQIVDVDFSGHELCTSDSWVQGINDIAPYHPTEDGQTEFTQQLLDAIRG